MDQFKIDHFSKANPGTPFPGFNSLSLQEGSAIRAELATRLGLSNTADGLVVLTKLREKAESIPLNADDPDFNLVSAFAALAITHSEHVLVNWYRFDRIDRLRFSDLSKFFTDLWYPVSDDIEIFDETVTWVLMVSHGGDLGLVRLP